jgi:hypothetical protein
MHRTRRVRVASFARLASAVLVAGACGSAARSGGGPPTVTTSPPAKLALASASPAAAPSAEGAAPAIFPVRPSSYVLDAALPGLGSHAVVRRMTAHTVSEDDVQRFARALGLTAAAMRSSTGWEVQEPSGNLTFAVTDDGVEVSYAYGAPGLAGGSSPGSVGASGSGAAIPQGAVANGPITKAAPPLPSGPITSSAPAVFAQPAPPVDVPSPAVARDIARGLLDNLGVLAGQSWSTEVNDSGGVAVSCAVGTRCPAVTPQVSARTVTFSLVLDGTRVADVAWSVTIGEHRRIESLNGEWAFPESLGTFALRSTAAVFADLQSGKARYAGPQPMMAVEGARAGTPASATPSMPARVIEHITGVSSGIARWNAYDHGHVVVDLVPTYRFHSRVDGGTPYDIEVLALDPGVVTFIHPSPTPEPLPAQVAPPGDVVPATVVSPPSP